MFLSDNQTGSMTTILSVATGAQGPDSSLLVNVSCAMPKGGRNRGHKARSLSRITRAHPRCFHRSHSVSFGNFRKLRKLESVSCIKVAVYNQWSRKVWVWKAPAINVVHTLPLVLAFQLSRDVDAIKALTMQIERIRVQNKRSLNEGKKLMKTVVLSRHKAAKYSKFLSFCLNLILLPKSSAFI